MSFTETKTTNERDHHGEKESEIERMDTLWMLMGRYNATPVIPIDTVVKDYFSHLNLTKFLRKISDGSIRLPLVRMENSQKSARGIHVQDLASYIDERTDAARRECNALHS